MARMAEARIRTAEARFHEGWGLLLANDEPRPPVALAATVDDRPSMPGLQDPEDWAREIERLQSMVFALTNKVAYWRRRAERNRPASGDYYRREVTRLREEVVGWQAAHAELKAYHDRLHAKVDQVRHVEQELARTQAAYLKLTTFTEELLAHFKKGTFDAPV